MSFVGKIHEIKDFWGDWFVEVEERWGRGKDLSITSLPELNDKIWGFRRKKMVIVGGRPSQGKSTLMLQIAWDLAKQGKRVFFFTFEMTKEDCLTRLFCNECEIDNMNITTGKITNMHTFYKDKINKFLETMKEVDLKIVEGFGKTFGEVQNIIDNFDSPDIIFIDYVNMIKQSHRSKKESIDEYVKDLRESAILHNFCIVLGAQINREYHKGTNAITPPSMWHLKESGCLEEHSDMVILVHWQYFYDREKNQKEYLINIAKNRDGKTGKITYQFCPQFYKIKEYDEYQRSNDNDRQYKD